MTQLPEKFIGYFGVVGSLAGHELKVLDYGGEKIPNEDLYEWAATLDSDSILVRLSHNEFKYFSFNGCTICGIARSLRDKRPGSKTLLVVGGIRDKEYLGEIIKSNDFIREKFIELNEKFCK